eukprot:TRINITY_DN23128_c0_g1_i1.p1 TRINITY_DN23128_c0_g1~~TRINITY_DN23128_c0_g1_i1.p1  ORF type:complete len:667 (+),score=99.19 TRINITY_DN23128_c0_g1_i1:83-2083(+)
MASSESLLSSSARSGFCANLQNALDSYFCVTQRGSTLSTEFRAGTTAFLATANNFVVNAQIMQRAGVSPSITVVSSAFASGVACISSGFLGNLPLGLVTSVGPNVFLAYSLVGGGAFTTDEALAISAGTGMLLLALSITPLLLLVLGVVPLSVKYGLVIGTGLLTSFIGLKSIGIVVADTGSIGGHNNIVALGRLETPQVYIAVVFLVITASMLHRAVDGAVLIGMLGATVVHWCVTWDWPQRFIAPSSLTFFDLDFTTLLQGSSWFEAFALLLMVLFSIIGAVIGCSRMAGLLEKDGGAPGSTAVYLCCGLGTIISAFLGSSPIIVSMSAAAGIRDGGRTGLVSITIGMLSLLTALLFSPLASAIPSCATAPVLVLVGVSMAGESTEVKWWNMQEALPAFLCAIFQPFTYSVSNGIYAGVAMAFVLFFSTGAFIPYLPQRFRTLMGAEDAKDMTPAQSSKLMRIKSSLAEVREEIEAADGFWYVPNEAEEEAAANAVADELAFPVTATVPKGGLRGFLRSFSPRRHAAKIIAATSRCLGLDGDAVQRAVLHKLGTGGARNGEAHCVGGIPGFESALALEVFNVREGEWLDVGIDDGAATQRRKQTMTRVNSSAPQLAALARRRRQHPESADKVPLIGAASMPDISRHVSSSAKNKPGSVGHLHSR